MSAEIKGSSGDMPEPVTAYPSLRIAWTAVIVLALIGAVAFVDRQVMALLVEPLKADLGLSDTQIGILQGFAFVVLYATAGVPLGFAVDRYSRRLIIFLGVVAWSTATVLSGLAHTYDQLLVARICVGLGEAALGPAAYSMMSDLFPKHRLAIAFSVFNLGLVLGSILALLVSGQIITAAADGLVLPFVGWRNVWQATFILVGLPGLLFSGLIFLIPEPRRRQASLVASTAGRLIAFLKAHRAFLSLHFLGFSLLMAVTYGQGAWAPVVLQRVYGWSIAKTSVYIAILYGVAGVVGQLTNGRAVDALFGRGVEDAHLRYYVGAASVIAVAGALSIFVPSGVWFVLALVPIVIAVNFGGVSSAAIQVMTPDGLRGRMASIYLLVVNILGVSLGPAGIAWINDAFIHDPKKIGISLGLFVAGAAATAAVSFAFGMAPMRRAVRANA